MRSVVVTGVAGSLGRRVARLLAGRDDVDRVIGVDDAPEPALPPGVSYLRVDLAGGAEAEAALAGAVAGGDGVIHLAWRTVDGRRPARAERREAAAANHLALRRVLAAAATTRPASLVHLSSATVYGAWADNPVPLPEAAALRPNPGLSFAEEKADAERMLAEFGERCPDVAVTILRPAATVGSPERPLYRALGGTGGPRPGDTSANRRVQYLHVDDLAEAVVLAWSSRLRGVYNVAPDAGIAEATARDLVGGVARVSVPPRVIGPVWELGWAAAGVGVPRAVRPYALHPWVVAADRLRAAGWAPRYSSEEALVATDVRHHWDDLPPQRRQRYTVVGAAAAAGAGILGLGGAGLAVLRRGRAQA